MNEKETVELSIGEAAVLAEYNRAIREIQQQIQGVYRLISRQHELTGSWDLSEDGKSLVRQNG